MRVVRDPARSMTAKRVTESLLEKESRAVIHDETGVPHFTVEMTEAPLGRTKMLRER